MATEIGDLFPYASGTSSLGVEQINGVDSGFTTDVRPFSHIHMNSGVLHNILGSSGVLRFGSSELEFSNDGGITFTSFNRVPLHTAYTLGNEVTLQPGYKGIILKETIPGKTRLPLPTAFFDATSDYGIVVSGFSLTPLNPNSAAATSIQSHGITIRSSGRPAFPASTLTIGYPDGFLPEAPLISTSGKLIVTSYQQLSLVTGAGDILIDNTDSGLHNNDINLESTAQIALKAFFFGPVPSGQLEYRFGPYESWQTYINSAPTSGPAQDGFWPIPHSGQIAQMITEGGGGGTLQQAYEAGHRIDTSTGQGGPVQIHGGTSIWGLHLSQTELGGVSFPHILMSGVIGVVSAATRTGSIFAQQHTLARSEDKVRLGIGTISSKAEADALSLGPNTLFYHDGSGVVNIRTCSGVTAFTNITNIPTISETEDDINFSPGTQLIPDTYATGVSNSGIIVLVPGLYRIQYNIFYEKTTGSLTQSVKAQTIISDQWGREGSVFGGASYASLRDNNAHKRNSGTGNMLVDINAGEAVNIRVNTTEAPPAGNNIRLEARSCYVILEYIGPQRGLVTKL